jgi:hypothetical protein
MIQIAVNNNPIQATMPIGETTQFRVVDHFWRSNNEPPFRTVGDIRSYHPTVSLQVSLGMILAGISVFSEQTDQSLKSVPEVTAAGTTCNPPSMLASERSERIVSVAKSTGVLMKRNLALEEGGIMLEFRKGDAKITFEIDNDGDVAYLFEKGGQSHIADINIDNFNLEVLQAFG